MLFKVRAIRSVHRRKRHNLGCLQGMPGTRTSNHGGKMTGEELYSFMFGDNAKYPSWEELNEAEREEWNVIAEKDNDNK